MKTAVITYLMGDNDKLLEPHYINETWDLVCFTNKKDLKSKNWNVVFVEDKEKEMNDKRFANFFKFNPFQSLYSAFQVNYDICITIDANVRIVKDLDKIVSFYCPTLYDITLAQHPIRNCVLEECNAIVGEEKDTKEAVAQNIKLFHQNKYPTKNGLYQTTIMIWKNTQATQILSSEFWKLYCNMSERDQILLPYVIWKNKNINIIQTKWKDFEEEFDYLEHYAKEKKDEKPLIKTK
tara:strand:- start:81 stop:791 length:711 start_codon:yes stop_codon:yes gene_type:complete